jgi:hypothetical protein
MQSGPPDPDALDSAWGPEEGEEDPDSTRLVDSRELFARAGFAMEEIGEAPPPEEGAEGGEASDASASDARITLPPPVPEDEYVARMMELRSSASQEMPSVPRSAIPWSTPRVADDFEGTLGALLAEQPTGLECDEPGITSAPGGLRDPGSPAIDTAEISVDDLSEELSTEPPPSPGSLLGLDSIDTPHPLPPPRPRGAAPRAAARTTPKPEEIPGIDFRLDLGFDVPDLPVEEPPPVTPPPGTLRYGLLEDDVELDVYGSRRPASLSSPEGPPRRESLRTLPSPPFPDAGAGKPPEAPPSSGRRHAKLKLRFDGGDYSGALVLAEALLDERPDDEAARRYADRCNEMLRQMYRSRIGDGSQVLRVAVSNEELRSLSLDHRAGFLLSCVDGYSSIDEVLDVSGMPELDALRILYELIQADIIVAG